MNPWLERWRQFWFAPVAPQPFAAIRIACGLLGLLHLAALSDIRTYWAADGLAAPWDHPALSAWLIAHGLAYPAGAALFGAAFVSVAAMTVGLYTGPAVLFALLTGAAELSWNIVPLSAAFELWLNLVFCLVCSDCGAVWSLDRWRAQRRHSATETTNDSGQPIWPLRLIQFQVAIIYLTSALWKVLDPHWRDGTALHYILGNTIYSRLPVAPPLAFDPWLELLTYATIAWEATFPLLLLHRTTRKAVLLSGVAVHLTMASLLELGPFTPMILTTYIAFWNPSPLSGRASTRLESESATSRTGTSDESSSAPADRIPAARL